MSKPEWAIKIAELRSRLGLSGPALAKALGVSAMSISTWERGQSPPNAANYVQLGKLAGHPGCWFFWEQAGLSRVDLMTMVPDLERSIRQPQEVVLEVQPARGVMKEGQLLKFKKKPDAVAIPLLRDSAAAGVPRLVDEASVEETLIVPSRMCPHPEATTAVRVKGDSMSPILEEDDIVAIDTTEVDRQKLYGKMVAARDEYGAVTIKWLRKVGQDELLMPQHTSLRHQPVILTRGSGWKIIGRVLWRLGLMP